MLLPDFSLLLLKRFTPTLFILSVLLLFLKNNAHCFFISFIFLIKYNTLILNSYENFYVLFFKKADVQIILMVLFIIYLYIFWKKAMATHSSTLAWRIPGTEEPVGLPSVGSHRGGTRLTQLSSSSSMHSLKKKKKYLSLAWLKLFCPHFVRSINIYSALCWL